MATLLEITQEYPTNSQDEETASLWLRLRKLMGTEHRKPSPELSRASACFTIYEESERGFVIFEAGAICRIIVAETAEDVECLALCRAVMHMLNDVQAVLDGIADAPSSAFRECALAEMYSMLRLETGSRRPVDFLEDVRSVDARLNGLFYQTIFHAYAELEVNWPDRTPDVEEKMYNHQDRVIDLWKNQSHASLLDWQEPLSEMLVFLRMADANCETLPELACDGATEKDLVIPMPGICKEEKIPGPDC